MATITLRFDDGMKRELDALVNSMGMNLSTFFMIYAKKSLYDRKIPFEITATDDPFFSSLLQSQHGTATRVRKRDNFGKTVQRSLQ